MEHTQLEQATLAKAKIQEALVNSGLPTWVWVMLLDSVKANLMDALMTATLLSGGEEDERPTRQHNDNASEK